MVAASQLSLLRAHVPDERPKRTAPEAPALFDFGELDRAAEDRRREIANFPEQLQNSDEELREAALRWALFLRSFEGQNCVKKVCRKFERAGVPVDARTVEGWISLSEPRLPGTNRHLLGAMLAYSPVAVLSVYMPKHEIVLAERAKEAEAVLRSLAGKLPQ